MTLSGDGGSFADRLDRAVADRGVTLTWVRRRLVDLGAPVSLATLSYWRSGRSQPERGASLDAVRVLEEVLALRAGELRSALAPSRRVPPVARTAPAASLVQCPDAYQAGVEALGFTTPQDEFVERMVVLTMDVDSHGQPSRFTCTAELRAIVDHAHRFPVVLTLDHEDAPAPGVVDLGNCSAGERHHDPGKGVFGVELRTLQPHARGQTVLVDYAFTIAGEWEPTSSAVYYAFRRLPSLVVRVRFDPARVPGRFEEVDTVDGFTGITEMHTVRGASTVHRHLRGFGPGSAGIQWHWQ